MRDEFTMKLDPNDDQPGYVVAEFRVDGDGWHHYYGWPDAPPGTPFKFTARGTNIKELIYGSLQQRRPVAAAVGAARAGLGHASIEYRAKDAAGNIGSARGFRVTVMPRLRCTTTFAGERSGDLRVDSGVACLDRASVRGNISVSAGASLVATNSSIKGRRHSRARCRHRARRRFRRRTTERNRHGRAADDLRHTDCRRVARGRHAAGEGQRDRRHVLVALAGGPA